MTDSGGTSTTPGAVSFLVRANICWSQWGAPDRIRTCAHGSGGRLCDLANLCHLPACNRSLISRTAKIIPRIFRIMETVPYHAGDGPRPVRAGSGLALGFWPEWPQRL